jgi:hypothetical protein
MSLEVIQPKNAIINHQPSFSHFLAPTPCLTEVVKRPDNFELSGNFFSVRGKILKVIKAQVNGITNSGITANIYIERTPGTNRYNQV